MKNWLYFALICTITGAMVVLWESKPIALSPEHNSSPFERFPYAVLHDARTSHFDEKGTLSYEFDAVTLKHFRADMQSSSQEDYMLITAPKMTIYGDTHPWHITAKQGKVMAQGEKLTLWDDVKIWQAANIASQGPMELTTQTIDIYPIQKRIATDAHVHIEGPSGTADADGLEVDMVSQRIKLLANVRGKHDPIQ